MAGRLQEHIGSCKYKYQLVNENKTADIANKKQNKYIATLKHAPPRLGSFHVK